MRDAEGMVFVLDRNRERKIMFGIGTGRAILLGHLLLVLSGILYAVAWTLGWDPGSMAVGVLALLLYAISLFSGLAGALLLLESLRMKSIELIDDGPGIRGIAMLGVLLYMVSFAWTSWALGRFFTAELFLLILWAVLEWTVLYVACRTRSLGIAGTVVGVILVGASLSVGVVLYIYYYDYEGQVRFVLGLVPYLFLSLVMLINGVLFFLVGKRGRRVMLYPDAGIVKRKAGQAFVFWVVLILVTFVVSDIFLFATWAVDLVGVEFVLLCAFAYFVVYYPSTMAEAFPDRAEYHVTAPRSAKRGRKWFLDRAVRELEAGGIPVEVHEGLLPILNLQIASVDGLVGADTTVFLVLDRGLRGRTYEFYWKGDRRVEDALQGVVRQAAA